jgi:predicted TIM-barrel fold metal-dependent hydrolase
MQISRNHWVIAAVVLLAMAVAVLAQQQGTATPAAEASAAALPFTDVHAHWENSDPQGSVEAAVRAMKRENATRIIFMPPPLASENGSFDAESILPWVKEHPDKVAVLGGGGTLNVMIQQSVHSGDTGPEVQRRFRQRAEQLLKDGAAGFGEMTAEHFQAATPYQHAPPDHPLFLLLSDIAAEHGVPIDLHMEAIPEDVALPAGPQLPPGPSHASANIEAFERLLAHNRRAQIIWAHAGWDNTGYRTPGLCRRLLRDNPNLYMDIKIDPLKPGKNSPLTGGASGALKPEWLKLFQDFPDRFVIGTDQHYPEPKAGLQRWQAAVNLLNQLPQDLRRKIGTENAARLYPAGKKNQ